MAINRDFKIDDMLEPSLCSSAPSGITKSAWLVYLFFLPLPNLPELLQYYCKFLLPSMLVWYCCPENLNARFRQRQKHKYQKKTRNKGTSGIINNLHTHQITGGPKHQLDNANGHLNLLSHFHNDAQRFSHDLLPNLEISKTASPFLQIEALQNQS